MGTERANQHHARADVRLHQGTGGPTIELSRELDVDGGWLGRWVKPPELAKARPCAGMEVRPYACGEEAPYSGESHF